MFNAKAWRQAVGAVGVLTEGKNLTEGNRDAKLLPVIFSARFVMWKERPTFDME